MDLPGDSFTDKMFRQRVVAQIEAAREGVVLDPGANSCEEMENIIYSNAKSRDEYMALIASLVLHLKEKKRDATRSQETNGDGGSNEGAANY